MIVWKFAVAGRLEKRVLVKLKIPGQSFIYLSGNSSVSKCRASQAKVLAITDRDGKPLRNKKAYPALYPQGYGKNKFAYEVGRLVKPNFPFSFKPFACESGIHFYLTRGEAARRGGV